MIPAPPTLATWWGVRATLPAVRDAHREVEAIAAAIAETLAAGDGVEIDQHRYESLRPRQQLYVTAASTRG